jgi:hypothetical protein
VRGGAQPSKELQVAVMRLPQSRPPKQKTSASYADASRHGAVDPAHLMDNAAFYLALDCLDRVREKPDQPLALAPFGGEGGTFV